MHCTGFPEPSGADQAVLSTQGQCTQFSLSTDTASDTGGLYVVASCERGRAVAMLFGEPSCTLGGELSTAAPGACAVLGVSAFSFQITCAANDFQPTAFSTAMRVYPGSSCSGPNQVCASVPGPVHGDSELYLHTHWYTPCVAAGVQQSSWWLLRTKEPLTSVLRQPALLMVSLSPSRVVQAVSLPSSGCFSLAPQMYQQVVCSMGKAVVTIFNNAACSGPGSVSRYAANSCVVQDNSGPALYFTCPGSVAGSYSHPMPRKPVAKCGHCGVRGCCWHCGSPAGCLPLFSTVYNRITPIHPGDTVPPA